MQSYLGAGLAALAMLHARENLEALENHYLNLLATPGTILTQSEGPANPERPAFYVVAVHQWGVSVMECRARRKGNMHYMDPKFDGKLHHQVLHIQSLAHWRCVPCTSRAPVECKDVDHLLIECCTKELTTLVKHAALDGFARLTSPSLAKLVRLLGVSLAESSRPSVSDMVAALVRHCQPAFSDQQVDEILQKRGQPRLKAKCDDLMCEGVEMAEQNLEEGDAKEFVQEVEECQKRNATRRPAAKAKRAPKQKPLSLPKSLHISTEDIRKYLPEVPGAKVSIERKWYDRIKVCYPKDNPPYWHDFRFTTAAEMRVAAVDAIRWVWEHHEIATGCPCPWQLV